MFEDRKVKVLLITLALALTAGVGIKAFVGFKQPVVTGAVVQTSEKNQEIVVYVTGAVMKQGLIKLATGSRLADALTAAGQAEDADLTSLNLAEKLKDGQKILIPRQVKSQPGGDLSGNSSDNSGNQAVGAANQASGTPAKGGKININTASAQELDALPGIGPAMAERIISYRTEKGPFTKPEELKDVPGIGDKKYADLLPLISVN